MIGSSGLRNVSVEDFLKEAKMEKYLDAFKEEKLSVHDMIKLNFGELGDFLKKCGVIEEDKESIRNSLRNTAGKFITGSFCPMSKNGGHGPIWLECFPPACANCGYSQSLRDGRKELLDFNENNNNNSNDDNNNDTESDGGKDKRCCLL
uniref:SAM domain-containing protein n=1 Tax=Lotharella oceanica TaxID=641309 RepID=A0A7S2TNF0_9EUKA|mmetsp:Transcript_2059/g.3933  ORF Transcript_2059/g.3933 Transcript_2059/m.3933 type:complete len:149 (+) Transcript_2059:3266-3712(+)|eukprot:CAMPEP_0170198934 /NCGR_PEP_ID=MMETSP0040_2-20121228/69062_1 /TAXON_ID=641309 /ORGANISM="Lotharella oceanica, Strain CCMP622" /LENGTH=148 /DNA_ID=CAMNT_0010449005 /DNA_START=3613 /DNA_END=4059 /DNA_ORIENTATION=+